VDVTIQQRFISNGYEIIAAGETFNAKNIYLSSTGEVQLNNGHGTQVARIELESFFSSIYNIIISGGGFYQFSLDSETKHAWICKGEGEVYRIVDHGKRNFSVDHNDGQIASFSKSLFDNHYCVHVKDETNLKLVLCMVLAQSVSEHNKSGPVIV
jgi:hypothetical protein